MLDLGCWVCSLAWVVGLSLLLPWSRRRPRQHLLGQPARTRPNSPIRAAYPRCRPLILRISISTSKPCWTAEIYLKTSATRCGTSTAQSRWSLFDRTGLRQPRQGNKVRISSGWEQRTATTQSMRQMARRQMTTRKRNTVVGGVSIHSRAPWAETRAEKSQSLDRHLVRARRSRRARWVDISGARVVRMCQETAGRAHRLVRVVYWPRSRDMSLAARWIMLLT